MMMIENTKCSRVSGAGEGEINDDFPIGMRVLAVDDDPVCLKVLETMLRCCQYDVTVTSRATTALKLLREKKDGFDLVISDVHMPDMDGFKLLELVGLEMDLPVIMLSVNSDKESVMRGITHGACNYLVKPVRIEELKNIWQHVIRRRFNSKDQNNHHQHGDTEAGNNCVTNGHQQDQGRRHTRKRKAQNEEGGYDSEENGHDNDDHDSSAQKKPRVVWSQMLHKKFVDAVNLLGMDKAVPKKILELMDVENLTRENVASHLQKYKKNLKKVSSSIIQHDDMFAFMGRIQSFAPKAYSIDDMQNNHYICPGSRQPSLPFLQQHRGYNRLNTAAGFSGLASSGSAGYQIGQVQRFTGFPPSHDPRMPPQYGLSRIQQAVPISFGRNQSYGSKPIPQTINTTFLRSSSNDRVPSSNPDYSLLFPATDNNHQLLQHQQFIGNDTDGLSRPTNTDHGAYNRRWDFDPPRRNASVTPISDHLTTGRELQPSYDNSNKNQLLSAVVGNTDNSNRICEEQRQEDQLQAPDHLTTTSPNNDDQVDSFIQKDGLQTSNGKPEEIMNMTTTQLDLTSLHSCKDVFGFEPTDFEIEMDANSYSSFDYLLHSMVKQDEHMSMDKNFLLT